MFEMSDACLCCMFTTKVRYRPKELRGMGMSKLMQRMVQHRSCRLVLAQLERQQWSFGLELHMMKQLELRCELRLMSELTHRLERC